MYTRASSFKALILFILVVILAGGAAFFWIQGKKNSKEMSNAADQNITIPDYSMVARAGLIVFETNCASCHGINGKGTSKGPPLLHEIYNPGHHSDGSFVAAVRQGVRSHHWNFGNMAAQPQVNDQEITEIVRYVRELQAANGIVYREHRMQ